MTSIARRIQRGAAVALFASLGGTGVVTAVALHALAVRAEDRALLAAVHAGVGAPGETEWEIEHSRVPIVVFDVEDGDPRVPIDVSRRARRTERPLWFTRHGRRTVVAVAEIRGPPGRPEHEEVHRLLAASAPMKGPLATVGRFLLAYSVVAAAAAFVASRWLRRFVEASFRPFDVARAEADAVVALGRGQRLSEDGPDEVRGLLASMNALLGRLDAAYAAQGRFTAEAAHELRTPVTAMLGELDVALRRPRSAEEYAAVLTSVRGDVDRMRRLVAALTAMARLDAGHADVDREPARPSELVDAARRAEATTLSEAGNDVTIDVVDDPEVEVHRGLVELALANLLRNAARHAPGTRVDVQVRRDGPLVVFTVDDGGPGVDDADRDALFDRFARAGVSRRRDPGGLGLGLPLAREVARRHGGDCALERSARGGVRASFSVFATARESVR